MRLWRTALLAALMLAVVVPASAQEPVEAEDSLADGVTVHVVQRGETLFRVAQTYGTTVEALQAANNILDPTVLEVGQRLIVPDGVSAPVALPSVSFTCWGSAGEAMVTTAFEAGIRPAA